MKRSHKNIQIIFGRNAVLEALETQKNFERIYIKDTLHGEYEKDIRSRARSGDIPLKKVPQIKLDRLCGQKNHQGIVAVISPITYQDIENVIPHIFEQGESPVLLVLDNIQDVGNIGAIARSCEVLGCHGIVLSGKSSALIGDNAIKASSGALFRLPVCRASSTLNLIPVLKAYGLRIYSTSLNATVHTHEEKFKSPMAVILGSEHSGLSPEIEKASDILLKIPQKGMTDSLNVSVAAGIILYEILKQSTHH